MTSGQLQLKFLFICAFLLFNDFSNASADDRQEIFDRSPGAIDQGEFVARHKIADSQDDATRLFKRLAQTSEVREQSLLASAILKQWAKSNSDTAMLLLSRSVHAAKIGETELARKLADDVVNLEPEWSEAFMHRARLRLAQGGGQSEIKAGIADLERALELEPRRFDALELLGPLYESLGEQRKALESYQKALTFLSANPELQAQERRLRLNLEQEKH